MPGTLPGSGDTAVKQVPALAHFTLSIDHKQIPNKVMSSGGECHEESETEEDGHYREAWVISKASRRGQHSC